MKRQILIKNLESDGFYFLRHGGEHDVYTNDDINIYVLRHRELNEKKAK